MARQSLVESTNDSPKRLACDAEPLAEVLLNLPLVEGATTNADRDKELIDSIDLLSLTATRADCM